MKLRIYGAGLKEYAPASTNLRHRASDRTLVTENFRMTAPPASTLQEVKTNHLAMAFQEIIALSLHARFAALPVENADGFRAALRKMISAALRDASAMGYSDEAARMANYAIVGFVDESIRSSSDPVFAEWGRRSLEQEIFGGHVADESFSRNVPELLERPESAEVADLLEVHALCLLLGYRGGGNASEIDAVVSRIREKIGRIRGGNALFRPVDAPAAPAASEPDRRLRRLAVTAAALLVLTLLAYAGYIFVLDHSMPAGAQSRDESAPAAVLCGAMSSSENSL